MKRMMLLILAAAMLLLSAGCAASGQLRVDFYNVGKADAMLITTPQGQRILIDAATNDEGKALAKRFEKEGIDAIDLMIITHFDKDHVGGADKIIDRLKVHQVLMPRYDKESKQYTQFLEAVEASADTQRIEMTTAQKLEFEAGGVQFTVTAAQRRSYGQDEENDFSLVVRMTYGDTRFLFAGDAEKARQLEILEEGDVACDVLKVPYHGRLTDASPAFIQAASPKIAFVTDSEEDPASEVVLSLLDEVGAQVYSARSGDLTVISDGTKVFAQ
ncbi:MAG: MBL fold metallo-hydrolase [Clostridia bacterium]|nr:MBL fold metallo-hydrolase [Clostridia bacterium]